MQINNPIINRFDRITANAGWCTVFEYTAPRCSEVLLQNGDEYIICSQSLRGYVHLLGKLPFDFKGVVYAPAEFAQVKHPARRTEILSNEDGIARLEVASVIAERYDFASIEGKKNPVFTELKKSDSLSYRKDNMIFVLEEERLIKRAVDDGTCIKYIAYTPKSVLLQNGTIEAAKARKIQCFLASEGLIASVTQTRPTPKEICVCVMPQYDPEQISILHKGVVLIADNVENPDNLGLVIRTADACGADAVISVGNTSIYNKNCVRASRGAMGRFPIFEYGVEEFGKVAARLKTLGYKIYGTSAKTNKTAGDVNDECGSVFSVSNETNGISKHMEAAADEMLRIPMATGQSSLNVAVAAGIILAGAIKFSD